MVQIRARGTHSSAAGRCAWVPVHRRRGAPDEAVGLPLIRPCGGAWVRAARQLAGVIATLTACASPHPQKAPWTYGPPSPATARGDGGGYARAAGGPLVDGGPVDAPTPDLDTDAHQLMEGDRDVALELPPSLELQRDQSGIFLEWPLPATGVTSLYGPRSDPVDGEHRHHYGLDLEANYGAVVAAAAIGRVVAAGWRGGHGRHVVLDHGFGYRTAYSHLSRVLVQMDDIVSPGQPIGLVGNSGRSTGPHLHLELQRHGRYLDPLDYLGTRVPID